MSRGRRAGDGSASPAGGEIRTGPASGKDAAGAFRHTSKGFQERQRSGYHRLPRVHAVLAADSVGWMASDAPDAKSTPAAGYPGCVQLVAQAPAPADKGRAPGARESTPSAVELLQGQWQQPKSGRAAASGLESMSQVA